MALSVCAATNPVAQAALDKLYEQWDALAEEAEG